jgi:glucosylceramidase
MEYWLTKGDKSILLKIQNDILSFGTAANNNPFIDVDTTVVMQSIDGFGYTLTDGSATVINSLSASVKAELLKELFGNNDNSIGISYLRVSMGASDLSPFTYTYNDLPAGQTDLSLSKFDLGPQKENLIPLLIQILEINPTIKILASPWSAPVWMKDNNSFIGGSLKPEYYGVYAKYFVKYIEELKSMGIIIDAITPQNEPLHDGNNPSMHMDALEQAAFIKNSLGPVFRNAGLSTKIIIYDHNADRPDYPLTVLNDPEARKFIDGSAFHLYGGDVSALTTVHNSYPEKHVYFTEQWTSSEGDFGGDLKWHLKNVIIGSMRNWSKNALEWNLANDGGYGPHTIGGCTKCKGALTINTSDISRNVSYYIIAHASKFVPSGSKRIGSNLTDNLYNVAFKTPDGKKVLIVENDGAAAASFNIRFKGKWVVASLPSGGVATYIWE